jgi:hypothetical protein
VLQADTQKSGSAEVTIVAPVSLSPRQAALTTSQTVQFQASGPGTSGAGVNWSASGGTISGAGLYTPPGAGIFTITVTSRADATAGASATVYVTDFAGQSSWRNDSGLTGQNRQELALNPATLAAGAFGKVSSCAVDGQAHAQPLYAANLSAGGRVRNIVYVATEHDSVYAFDADAIPCQQVWMRNFLDADNDITTVLGGDIPGGDISSEVGIASTPVINQASGTLYVIARTKEDGPFGPNYVQRLHALDIVTGSEKFGGPVVIAATAPGSGNGSNGSGLVVFDARIQSQRGALMLAGGKLYITFSGHSDVSGYHGWLLIYDPSTLSLVGAFNTTPNVALGGFPESGVGVSADANGYVFAATGHGKFDAGLSAPFRKNFSQTLFKFQLNPSLTIVDTFTPSSQAVMTVNLFDLGSTGVMILPDQAGAPNPHLAIVGGTNGTLYLVNRDALGGFVLGGPDNVVKTLSLGGNIYGTPAYWQNTLYVAAAGDAIKAYSVNAGTIADASGSQSVSLVGSPGASPTVSSNGGSGGIVWVADTSGADSGAPAVLRAFDATNLARELYNSGRKPEDTAGPAVRLAVPTVANGRVYIGTQTELTVYGLVP